MKTKKRIFGDFGEKIAAEFLSKNGYTIIDKNFSCKYGELDIICSKFSKKFNREEMFFVEVKTRTNKQNPIYPENAVNFYKKERLQKTAEIYLNRNNLRRVFYSFSCVAIIVDNDKNLAKIKFFERI